MQDSITDGIPHELLSVDLIVELIGLRKCTLELEQIKAETKKIKAETHRIKAETHRLQVAHETKTNGWMHSLSATAKAMAQATFKIGFW